MVATGVLGGLANFFLNERDSNSPWGSAGRHMVLGVVAAHDRAIRLLPKRHQLTGQLPLLFAMVGFTVGGLYLLFAA